jgi:hypothetical protein
VHGQPEAGLTETNNSQRVLQQKKHENVFGPGNRHMHFRHLSDMGMGTNAKEAARDIQQDGLPAAVQDVVRDGLPAAVHSQGNAPASSAPVKDGIAGGDSGGDSGGDDGTVCTLDLGGSSLEVSVSASDIMRISSSDLSIMSIRCVEKHPHKLSPAMFIFLATDYDIRHCPHPHESFKRIHPG